MTAIGTNVLVRLVVRDNLPQYEQSLAFVEKHRPVWVAHLSMLELAWVLWSCYRLEKAKVCEVMLALLEMAELHIQQPAVIEAAVRTWQVSTVDFADAFILETARAAAEMPLGTFDAALGRLEDVQVIGAVR